PRQPLDPTRKPAADDRPALAEPREQPVIAAARHQRADRAPERVVQLEHETGVIVEAAAEAGREANAGDVDAARGQQGGAAFEGVERGLERDLALPCKPAQLG